MFNKFKNKEIQKEWNEYIEEISTDIPKDRKEEFLERMEKTLSYSSKKIGLKLIDLFYKPFSKVISFIDKYPAIAWLVVISFFVLVIISKLL